MTRPGRYGAPAAPGGTTRPARELDQAGLESWAGEVGRAASAAGAFVCLYGELGAGKSTFVRAACRGVGVRGPVPSPTFTLVLRHVAEDGARIWHADLYRVESPSQLVDAGWPELLEADGAVFVEWADRAGDWLPAERWDVRLSFTGESGTRAVSIEAVGGAPRPPGPDGAPC